MYIRKTNGTNVLKLIEMYIENHGIPRSLRLDQEKCLVGHHLKTFCIRKNIEIIEAPVTNHQAVALLEIPIQTINSRIASIKEEELATISFNIKHALNIFRHQLRICKQKTTKVLLLEAHLESLIPL